MDESEILDRIHGLVETERELRQAHPEGTGPQERERLRQTEEALDQCWDLLRQRRAHAEFGQNPNDSSARPLPTVEGYLQ